ncbi:MAG: nucleoside triphosphate pyrophosphohydrolase [Xanthomonadales bacterium]|uniref:nucleoside triphosphate pyrophosphohydrolase n=1 Tax=Dokdonella sp. TaxID=2291710 RepID=UPI002C4CD7E3|nr:nucleoside triphosphate pyrophosphohydrolase [Xanthomonadales bacterium]MBK7013741.1 nucleoside triphosphate pyrophosphohydrolase [Xanthomonadales bacterium]MBK7209499.1 nucleoside triphosphate pyrophosphohydrolase [Xanthomonadales bacterium]MBL0223292.1 nucleoside triphosphate pyrophosphohydrolase [Xanthomonadales bacterium]HQW76528.1 nucleoside triphosphate pyrophosphohydrolase [Dokdonella sp.]
MPNIDDLLAIMARLRDPDNGCPWDVEQSFETIVPYTIEEAYEVADAVDRRDYADLRDELGDLLLQVVFHARMAEEAGHFRFEDVVAAICNKMVSRHPHVFAEARADTAEEVLGNWEAIKRREREDAGDADRSALAGIARGLPEWQRATKLQKRAARVGFDWPDVNPVFDKLHEEIDEVRAEFAGGADPARLTDEIGDVLFVCANLARHAHVDVSTAMRHANAKFERRFRRMEAIAAEAGTSLAEKSLEQQEDLWLQAKREERLA